MEALVSRIAHTVLKVIDFPRYNMKFSGENVILRGIVYVVSRFPLHFMSCRRNLNFFYNSARQEETSMHIQYCTSKDKIRTLILS